VPIGFFLMSISGEVKRRLARGYDALSGYWRGGMDDDEQLTLLQNKAEQFDLQHERLSPYRLV
jgi:hypothetical protein